MSKYGYIGPDSATPTQSSSQNHGVFKPNDVIDLLGQGKYKLQPLDVSYLVIAGGGGAGGDSGGGGGGGGYRNSYASETSGDQGSTETPLEILPGTSFTVTVGGGGSGSVNNGAANGSDSVFSSVTSVGGGKGGGAGGAGGAGGSGGGCFR